MLKWALIFLVISIVAGILGFTGIASGAARISKILFVIAIAIFLLFLVLGLVAGEAIFWQNYSRLPQLIRHSAGGGRDAQDPLLLQTEPGHVGAGLSA